MVWRADAKDVLSSYDVEQSAGQGRAINGPACSLGLQREINLEAGALECGYVQSKQEA